MTSMNVSLPDELKSFVDQRVGQGGFGSTSEYVRHLIRRDQERERLRRSVLDGRRRRRARSPTARTSSRCGPASEQPTEVTVATSVRLRRLAATDLDDSSDRHRHEAGEQVVLEFIDAVERAIEPPTS